MKQIDERVKNDEIYFKNYVDYSFDELFHRVEELERLVEILNADIKILNTKVKISKFYGG